MRTGFCDLLNIDVPIVLAPFGPWEQVQLAAAVCEARLVTESAAALRRASQLTSSGITDSNHRGDQPDR